MSRSKLALVIGAVVAVVAFSPIIYAEAMKYNGNVSITGSANLAKAIEDFIKENRKVSFMDAAKSVEDSVGNGIVVKGRFSVVQGYLAYVFDVIDPVDNTRQRMIVDVGNGSILYSSDPIAFKSSKYSNLDVISISEAAGIASKEVNNGTVDFGSLKDYSSNPVYSFLVRDADGKMYRVKVDASDGSIIDVVELVGKYGYYGYGKYWDDDYWKHDKQYGYYDWDDDYWKHDKKH